MLVFFFFGFAYTRRSKPLPPIDTAKGRVAVIGGGLSGLTAAYTLRSMGIEAIVYESQLEAGGQVKGRWDAVSSRPSIATGHVCSTHGAGVDGVYGYRGAWSCCFGRRDGYSKWVFLGAWSRPLRLEPQGNWPASAVARAGMLRESARASERASLPCRGHTYVHRCDTCSRVALLLMRRQAYDVRTKPAQAMLVSSSSSSGSKVTKPASSSTPPAPPPPSPPPAASSSKKAPLPAPASAPNAPSPVATAAAADSDDSFGEKVAIVAKSIKGKVLECKSWIENRIVRESVCVCVCVSSFASTCNRWPCIIYTRLSFAAPAVAPAPA